MHPAVASAQPTLPCLTRCAIGETAGLFIDASLGLGAGWTIGFIFFSLFKLGGPGLGPFKSRAELSFKASMNGVDYMIGEVQGSSVWGMNF